MFLILCENSFPVTAIDPSHFRIQITGRCTFKHVLLHKFRNEARSKEHGETAKSIGGSAQSFVAEATNPWTTKRGTCDHLSKPSSTCTLALALLFAGFMHSYRIEMVLNWDLLVVSTSTFGPESCSDFLIQFPLEEQLLTTYACLQDFDEDSLVRTKERSRKSRFHSSTCRLPILQGAQEGTGAKRKRQDKNQESEREQHLRTIQSSVERSNSKAQNVEPKVKKRWSQLHPALRDVSQVRLEISLGPEFIVDFADCNGDSICLSDVQEESNMARKACDGSSIEKDSNVPRLDQDVAASHGVVPHRSDIGSCPAWQRVGYELPATMRYLRADGKSRP